MIYQWQARWGVIKKVKVLATFSIYPTRKTITFQYSGRLIILPLPKKIVYDIKEAEGDVIKTETYYWNWVNLSGQNKTTKSHLYSSTSDNKKFFTFVKHGSYVGAPDTVVVKFENCKKIIIICW